jgi:hypothetical protein
MQYGGMQDQVLALTEVCRIDVIFITLQSSDWYHTLTHCVTEEGHLLDLAIPSLSKNKALGEVLG